MSLQRLEPMRDPQRCLLSLSLSLSGPEPSRTLFSLLNRFFLSFRVRSYREQFQRRSEFIRKLL